MRVKLHPHARAELRAACNWYHERSPLSAFAFAQTVQNAISKIKETPNTFPVSNHGTRKFVLQQFPFNIFYLTRESEIVIVRNIKDVVHLLTDRAYEECLRRNWRGWIGSLTQLALLLV